MIQHFLTNIQYQTLWHLSITFSQIKNSYKNPKEHPIISKMKIKNENEEK